jgi:hypothetical protein
MEHSRNYHQGILTEVESFVQLTSLLRYLLVKERKYTYSVLKAADLK